MEPVELSTVNCYQLRIWLKRISPMIWRRVVLNGNISIKDLHYIIQIIMGWSDTHLNTFTIHGKTYGVPHIGGVNFKDNPAKITFDQLRLRKNEKFTYEYDFISHWMHEIRVEKVVKYTHKLPTCCITGSRAAPPEDCGGPLAYMRLLDQYNPVAIEHELFEIIESIYANTYEEGEKTQIIDRLATLNMWYQVNQFPKAKINQQLKRYFSHGEP